MKTPFIDISHGLLGMGPQSKYFTGVWRRHRQGAKKRGIPFEILPEDVAQLYLDQGARCAVTGLEFDFTPYPSAFVKCPLQPSIDRINSGAGYVKGNVRLVCTAVNFGLGQWGDDLFMKLARAAVAKAALKS